MATTPIAPMTDKEKKINQARDTGLALVLICLLGAMAGYRIALTAGMLLLIATMTWPALFTPAARVWFGFSHLLGSVVSKVLLSVVFFCIATPMGALRRMAGKDAMKRNSWKKGDGSLFSERNHRFAKEDLEQPF